MMSYHGNSKVTKTEVTKGIALEKQNYKGKLIKYPEQTLELTSTTHITFYNL